VPELTAEFIDTADPSALDAACVNDIKPKAFFIDATGPEIPE